MPSDTLVSVIIPVFNQRVEYLVEAVKSASNALRNVPHEIVICDDGSDVYLSENYKERLAGYQSVLLFCNNTNFGMNVARNLAVLRSSGKYILLLDSDDILCPEVTDTVISSMGAETSIIFTDHAQYDATLSRVIQFRNKTPYFNVLSHFIGTEFDPFLHCTFLFHPQIYLRTAFVRAGGFDCSYSSGDEIALQLKIMREATISDIAYLPVQFYRYRKNPDSVVHDKALYSELIANIEAIIRQEFFLRHGRRVSVKWFSREVNLGAAHYSIQCLDLDTPITPPWFDRQSSQIVSPFSDGRNTG
ncbi:MAG: glycosyltransferase [Roseibium sp.]